MDLSNENVIHVKNGEIEFLQFRKLLEYKEINHAYSLNLDRSFRTCTPYMESLSPEDYQKAIDNYKCLCSAIGTDYTYVVRPNQTHTDAIKIVNKKINKDEPDINLQEYKNIDGIITNKENIVLSTTNADCILFLFYDPVKKVIANVHSGWKGTLKRISVKTVEKMKDKFNCNPKDIICCIAPSIRKCHFEVEKDVKDLYVKEFKYLDQAQIIEEKVFNKKWNIDTVLINKIILKKAGLKEENIIDSGICSKCNSDVIHSYRAQGKGYGLNTAIISQKLGEK